MVLNCTLADAENVLVATEYSIRFTVIVLMQQNGISFPTKDWIEKARRMITFTIMSSRSISVAELAALLAVHKSRSLSEVARSCPLRSNAIYRRSVCHCLRVLEELSRLSTAQSWECALPLKSWLGFDVCS